MNPLLKTGLEASLKVVSRRGFSGYFVSDPGNLMHCNQEEYWSGMPFVSPGHLPIPGVEPWSPVLQADIFPTELPWRGGSGVKLG